MNLLTKIPPSVRQVVYLAYALVGVAFGAISNADSFHDPHWLVVAVGIYAYVGTALGITAHVNVPAKAEPKGAVAVSLKGDSTAMERQIRKALTGGVVAVKQGALVVDTPDPAAVADAEPAAAAAPAAAEPAAPTA